MHPDDLRALVAGMLWADPQAGDPAGTIRAADILLAELAPAPHPAPGTLLVQAFARVEKAEADLVMAMTELDHLKEHMREAERTQGETNLRVRDLEAQLADATTGNEDAATAGEPEIPWVPYDGTASLDQIKALAAWGRQGWSVAGALQASMAGMEGRIQQMCKLRVELAREESTHAERERIRKALRLLRWNYLLQDGTGVRTFRAEDVDAALADPQPTPAEKEVPNA
jgi:hypothetical protein